MPKYKITDPTSGKSFVVTGDSPPTEDEANQIFGSPTQTSQSLGFYQGLMKPFDKAASWLESGANSIPLPGTGHSLGDAVNDLGDHLGFPRPAAASTAHANFVADQARSGTVPGKIGQFTGEMAGTLPLAAVTRNPALLGGLSGALLSDSNDAGGVLKDTAIGAAGGKLGDLAIRGLARITAPAVRPMVQKLIDEGVNLTPGQIMGGLPQRLENGFSSIPIVGDMVKNAQARSIDSFNRAAVNRALTPIGQSLPASVATGHEAVDHAITTLGDAYDRILPRLKVTADKPFASAVINLHNLAQNLPPDAAALFTAKLKGVLGQFSPNGAMSGETMKAIESELGQLSRGYGGSSVGSERMLGNAFREVQDQLRQLVTRSNPADASALQSINRGYANLIRVQRAASQANGGIFTPAQLQTATRVADQTLNKRASARGGALMQDLATAGRDVLPSKVPDSGTAGRAMLGHLALSGGVGYVSAPAAIGLIGGGLAYTKPGTRLIQALLTQRPPGAAGLGNLLTQLKTPAAIFGSGAAINAYTPPN